MKLVVCGKQGQHSWGDPNRVLVIQDGVDPSEAKVFRAHAAGCVRESLVCTQVAGHFAGWLAGTTWWRRSSKVCRSSAG